MNNLELKRAPAFDDTDHTSRAECWLDREQAEFAEDAASLAGEFEDVFRAGWGWALAILTMAEAIRKNAPRLVRRDYGTYDPTHFTCFCPGCGAYMKHLRTGVDEGTNNEWCGSCRY